MNLNLTGQCVLVSGASGGIGLATARAFAAEGASLALHYNTHVEPIETLRQELTVLNVPVQADLRDESAVDAMFDTIAQAFPRIDAVVVNAGVWHPDSVALHEMSVAQWEATALANARSAFLTCRAFLRHLKSVPREAASIVLVGSTAALFGEAGHADYAAAKAAVAYGLTLSLKNEIVCLAPRGRVNCVCPGWTDTPMVTSHSGDPQKLARAHATMTLQKIASPQDVASAIVYLTSEQCAGHISGAILPVAGGMEGRMLRPLSA